MTDFEAEQEEELECLEAILADEFIPDEGDKRQFSIVVNDLEFMNSPITLDFKHTDTYPDEPPEFAVQPTMQLLPDMKTRMQVWPAASCVHGLQVAQGGQGGAVVQLGRCVAGRTFLSWAARHVAQAAQTRPVYLAGNAGGDGRRGAGGARRGDGLCDGTGRAVCSSGSAQSKTQGTLGPSRSPCSPMTLGGSAHGLWALVRMASGPYMGRAGDGRQGLADRELRRGDNS